MFTRGFDRNEEKFNGEDNNCKGMRERERAAWIYELRPGERSKLGIVEKAHTLVGKFVTQNVQMAPYFPHNLSTP